MPCFGRGGVDGCPGGKGAELVAFYGDGRGDLVSGDGFFSWCAGCFAGSVFSVPAPGNGGRGWEADGSYCRILGIGFRVGGNFLWNGSGSDLVAVPSVAWQKSENLFYLSCCVFHAGISDQRNQ